ncbi:MAG: ROK family protein [Limnochordia bacterium]|jgi:glucokinase|nr:ROK family protein [Limnochordia bacterium]MDD2630500.1 ROK family protein [Limnochordia bacterium]MDD4518480.1 ROK family protein [Limnochordia bacterium]
MSLFGLDIGGTKCAVIKANEDNRPNTVKRFATSDVNTALQMLFNAIVDLGIESEPIFGVSCGGPLDTKKGLILSPPNLPGWDEIPIVDLLEERFGGKAYLMNDADASAIAEWKFGAGRGSESMVFLTFGTGMGAGLILDGRLYTGSLGLAGEVGHIRMAETGPKGHNKYGSFEGFCSGGGIAQLAQERARKLQGKVSFNPGTIDQITTKDVGEAAARGDDIAQEILALSGSYLGMGLAILIDLLNPEAIVLGSIYGRCQQFLEPTMRQVLSEEALPMSLAACRILPAALGEEIGNYAAISAALYSTGRF